MQSSPSQQTTSKFGGIVTFLGWVMIVLGILGGVAFFANYSKGGDPSNVLPLAGLASAVWGILFCAVGEVLSLLAKIAGGNQSN